MYENRNTTFAQSGANLVQITCPSAHQMLRSARIQNIATIGRLLMRKSRKFQKNKCLEENGSLLKTHRTTVMRHCLQKGQLHFFENFPKLAEEAYNSLPTSNNMWVGGEVQKKMRECSKISA